MDGLSFAIEGADGAIPTLDDFDLSGALRTGRRLGGARNRQLVIFRKEKQHELRNVFDEKGRIVRKVMQEVERELVRIVTPGDKNVYDGEVQEFHKREFFPQYSAFRAGKTGPIGKLLDDCDYIPPAIALELRMLGVHTQEQLADASDTLCERIPDGWELREHARVVAASERVDASKEELARVRKLAEDQAQANAEMAEELEKLRALMRDAAESTPPQPAKKSRKAKAKG